MEGALKDTAETRAQMKTNGIPHDIYIGYLFLLYEETFEFMVKYHGTNERELSDFVVRNVEKLQKELNSIGNRIRTLC